MLMATFAMTDLGDVTQVLGIEIKSNKELGTIELNQGKYTLSVLECFNMRECKSSAYARDWKGTQVTTRRKCASGRASNEALSRNGRESDIPHAVYEI